MKKTLMLSLALTLLVVGAPYLMAGDAPQAEQEMKHEEHHAMEAEGASDDMKMQQMHEQMMERHQQMLEKMKQQKAELDSLVERMNAAEGDARVDAMAALLEELVSQHQMHMSQRMEMMEKMGEGGMMTHGMGAMHHGGMMKGHGHHGKDCPMGEDCPMHQEMMEKMKEKKGDSSRDGH